MISILYQMNNYFCYHKKECGILKMTKLNINSPSICIDNIFKNITASFIIFKKIIVTTYVADKNQTNKTKTNY